MNRSMLTCLTVPLAVALTACPSGSADDDATTDDDTTGITTLTTTASGDGDGDPIPEQAIDLLVGLDHADHRPIAGQLGDRKLQRRAGQIGVEALEGGTQAGHQHDVAPVATAQRTGAMLPLVHGKGCLPAEGGEELQRGAFESIFGVGVGVGHAGSSL